MTLAQAHTSSEFGTVWRMISGGTPSTQVIMLLFVVFSLVSWTIIVLKLLQFRRLRREADDFIARLETSGRLDDAYQAVLALPESPFTRVFRRGMTFYNELKGARGGAPGTGEVRGLLPTQLEVLRLVLEKEEADERDSLTKGIYWLAIFATVSPLLGLLGTVIGVMNSFIGVAAAGSSSITAVAPGIAEALVATAGGLVVAIPAAMGYNYLTGRLNLLVGELEGFSSEFIGALAREGRI